MKTILIAIFFLASSVAYAQKSCDDLKGMEKEACLKKGGTVQAAKKEDPNWPKQPKRLDGERYAEPGAPTDYSRHDDRKRENR